MGGLPSAPIPVTLPNDLDIKPGDKAELWYYDAAPFPGVPGAWRLAGLGTVSPNGATIVSDPGVGIQRFCGVCGLACFIPRQEAQPNRNPDAATGGDPVDLFLGQMIVEKTDLVLPGRIPAIIHRTYNPFEPFGAVAGFELGLGPGWALSVDMVVQAETATLRRLILPGNARFAFVQQPNGTFVNTTHARFAGAVLTAGASGTHTLRLKDGTLWRFAPTQIPNLGGLGLLVEQADRNGNRLIIERNSSGAITRLIEPAGRALVFTHSTGRIVTITDPIGRTVQYSYNSSRRLETITDPAGGVTRYTYDTAGRILTITDPRGIT
jgi:YD repeat-containing protein